MSEEEIKIQISEALSKCYGIEIKEITRNENSTVGNVYNIKVRNNTAKSTISEQVVQKFVCNGEEIKENRLKIIPNSGIYNIEVEI